MALAYQDLLEGMNMRPEARREKRIPINILLNKYVNGEPHLCRGMNLSRGGMLVYRLFEPDQPQQEVRLEFQLPGSERIINIRGVVLKEHRWARAHGVKFVDMKEEDRASIDRYLRREALATIAASKAANDTNAPS
jgi:hypothetical protein